MSDVRVGFKEKEKCGENPLIGTKCRNLKIRKSLFFFILNTLRFTLPNFAGVNFKFNTHGRYKRREEGGMPGKVVRKPAV